MDVRASIVRVGWHPDRLSVHLPLFALHHKIQKMVSNDGGSDQGYSKFCVTVGTMARTAGILICGWLKALAVNLSQLSDFGCMLA